MNGDEKNEGAVTSGTLPFLAKGRCGDDAATAGPLTEGDTASESAGESYAEPSTGAADTEAAEDNIGLVTEGCVKLGEDVAADTCSLVNTADNGGIEGAVGAGCACVVADADWAGAAGVCAAAACATVA